MNEPDPGLMWSGAITETPPDRILNYQDTPAPEEQPDADLAAAYTSGGFIAEALRRRRRVWATVAVLGLLIGSGVYVKFPPSYKASATLLLTNNPTEDPANASVTNTALAQSNTVAAMVVHKLGLNQSVASFQAAVAVTALTDQVLTVTVSAPSSSAAVTETSALVTNFLQFRATYLRNQQKLLTTETNLQVSEAQQRLGAITREINQLSAQPATSDQQTRLKNLEAESSAEAGIVSNALANLAAGQTTMNTIVDGSQLLNTPAPVHQSRFKRAALYVGGGLIAGLALGIGVVLLMALTSDRLRRRDDIADAMGAPVRLSVGPLQPKRLGLRGRAARDRDSRRVVAHLRGAVPGTARGTAGLAVVAVDNAQQVAAEVKALAVSYAREGRQVVVADLAGGALAKRLGVRVPGVSAVNLDGQRLVAVVPDHDDPAPIGPLNRRAADRPPSEALLAACGSADLLLTLTTLEPTLGGDHLATWATDAVATVSAGRSSAARIHAVGEMIRVAGMRLASVVVISADKRDESLGVILAARRSAPV